ncbi:MAG: N-6 DNA methylase [Candidatus Micrarchaeaceae archaeon]
MTSKKFNQIINNIRDILNCEAITGRNGINYCVIFLVVKFLDESMSMLNGDKNVAYEKICGLGPKFNLRGFKIKSAENLYNILFKLKDLNLRELNEDYVGTIYEIYLKSKTTNCKDLGQYFTNRKIVNYMINMVNPQIGETICDPAMGTGGFLAMYVKKLQSINWSEYKNHIYGFDIDEEIANLATLNLFLQTGEKFDNLACMDSLTSNINNKFDVILSNLPMGLNVNYNLCSNKIKELKIKASKSEILYIQLIMQLLKQNGRACITVPEGFLANKDKTREYLIENFEVQKIVHLKGKFFLNSNVEIYVLYFLNSGKKTEKVDFYVYDKDYIETKILELKYEEIVSKGYKLLYKFYISMEINCHIPCYKIKDICVFLPSGKHNASYGKDSGLYPFFTASKIIKYCDEYDYDIECIIISKGGQANINYGTKFSCSSTVYVLTSKYEDVLVKYIYWYLKSNLKLLENGFYGTGLKHITREYIENIEIPVPSLEEQINIINKIYMLNGKIEKLHNMLQDIKQERVSMFNQELIS